MGVDYRAVAMYGMYFRDMEDVQEFVEKVYPNATVDYEGIDGEPLLEGFVVQCLNSYSGSDWILGFNVAIGETLDDVEAQWAKAFPDNIDDATTHLEVEV